MWKNKKGRKTVKPLYTTYRVTGLNLNALINKCAKEGVFIKNVKKIGKKSANFTVNLQENRKFFAICKDLCYNVKKIRDRGALYPLLFLFRNIGLLVGALVFIVSTVIVNDVIFSIEFYGTGKVYSKQVERFLQDENVQKYTRFSSIDLKRLEDDILRTNQNLTFASCVKRGNTLQIELVLSTEQPKILQENVYSLKSETKGEVEWIKVYRGTPKVNVGDKVEKGDVLVDGYVQVKDYNVTVNVLAYVGVRVEFTARIFLPQDNLSEQASMLVLEEVGETNAKVVNVQKIKHEKSYEYVVTVNYLQVYCAG